ncbi:delta-latroinsectotoxin-Lt1a isoform X2 [Patella vulgata]|nr:delta-latroinsectotoxin-Lt1a isoform X2 [Patella vulgata]
MLVNICQSAPNDLLKLIFDKTIYDTMNEFDQTGILEIRNRLLQGGGLDDLDTNKKTLLHYACQYSTLTTVQYLIDNNCNVNCVGGKYEITPVFYCCYKDVPQAVEKMQVLVSNGANLDVTDIDKTSLLHKACGVSTVEAVQYLIDNNCNVNCVGGKYKMTPVFYCCDKDVPKAVEKMQVLVSNGANLDVTDINKTPLLHRACLVSTVEAVQYLIDNNCNVNCVGGKYKITPVFYCCYKDVPQAVEKMQILVSNGANLDVTAINKTPLLHRACAVSTVEAVQYLIDNNCNVNGVGGKYNRTPLFYCCDKDVPKAVEKMQVLVSNGAKLAVIDDKNFTPLHQACAFSTLEVVKYLLDSNCNVKYKAGRYNNKSVFYSCCISETHRIDKIKLLLSRGAKLEKAEKSFCINTAMSLGYYDTVEFVKTIPVKRWYQFSR